jgi:hypothetical protein
MVVRASIVKAFNSRCRARIGGVTIGRRRVDHKEEALLSGWKLGDIVLGVRAANVLLHRSISLLADASLAAAGAILIS